MGSERALVRANSSRNGYVYGFEYEVDLEDQEVINFIENGTFRVLSYLGGTVIPDTINDDLSLDDDDDIIVVSDDKELDE